MTNIPPTNRLWTPWRMAYVGDSTLSAECVFCNAFESADDVASLVIYRGEHAFVILNLYPYNTGHLMVVPNQHVSNPASLSQAARAEMAELTASFCVGLQEVMGCDGLNAGMNLGSAAGAGIADHLHQHLVPRWTGDANFMPIIGGTKVLPELLPATYGKIRAEVARQSSRASTARLVLISSGLEAVYLQDGVLPEIALNPDEPVWKSAMAFTRGLAASSSIAGWAGGASTSSDAVDVPALSLVFEPGPKARLLEPVTAAKIRDRLPERESANIAAGLTRLRGTPAEPNADTSL